MEIKELIIEELYNLKVYVYSNGYIETCFHSDIRINGRIQNIRGKILKPSTDKDGYYRIVLTRKDKRKSYYVHRLIARAFLENYSKDLQVNHKNGIKTDNRIENLEMVTLQENIRHSIIAGLKPKMIRDKKGRFLRKEVM